MVQWILDNRQWLFSGVGVTVITVVWWLFRLGRARWKEGQVSQSSRGSVLEAVPVLREPIDGKRRRSLLPAFLSRLMLDPLTVASKIDIALRGDCPINLYLDGEVPHLELYFDVTNLSGVDLILDRMLIEVWFGQPTFTAAILRRYSIPAGQIVRNVSHRHELTEGQQKQIRAYNAGDTSRGSLHFYLTAYFESRIGRVQMQFSIERRKL